MFQEPRLLPWARVLGNVAVGLTGIAMRGAAPGARAEHPGRGRPGRPRAAIGRRSCRAARDSAWRWRARWSRQPQILALDEPLGALDALTRIEMQGLLERVWRDQGFTAVLVTHDVTEAVVLADRVLLIEEGLVKLDLEVTCPGRAAEGRPDRRPRRGNPSLPVRPSHSLKRNIP